MFLETFCERLRALNTIEGLLIRCFPLKDIYDGRCQRKRHFGDDTDVNRTRLKDIVIERFPVLKEEIGFGREVMLVPASAMKHLVTTSLYCNSSHDCRALSKAALIISPRNSVISQWGHSTSNEQVFRNQHALRLRIVFNLFSVLPNYPSTIKFKKST